ncbi:McrBC 5-methylcytosine restriction system component [uncultured Candidatus Thioglobus sp.]|nr:McrBC 5-methylcytosine restriction system component [uncultured Candidatus Thioglobus sp.]
MHNELYIREFGRILKDKETAQISVKEITLNPVDWDFLANHANSNFKDDKFIDIVNLTTLRVKNFVGVITTPSGTQIEILPKIDNGDTIDRSRLALEKMLKVVNNLPFIQTTKSNLKVKNQPLPEVLIGWFLGYVDKIVKQGIRKDYNRINAQEKFLKGQLQTHKQLNEPPHKQHLFHIEYDVFSMNRAENRLIHSALLQALKWSKDNHNQKQAKHFLMLFDEVPLAKNYKNDFLKWSKSRDMDYYQSVLPWLKLILNQQSPFTIKDKNAGISFLIPMEKLFERYVAKMLSKKLPQGFYLREQVSSKYLSDSPKAFQMKPDIAIYKGDKIVRILDTKWKLIDQNATYENGNNDKKKDISQSDVYQLFAYGKKYKVDEVVLIYPKWEKFDKDFSYKLEDDLMLKIESFDISVDA